jgi:hypothetical protein
MLMDTVGAGFESVGRVLGAVAVAGVGAVRSVTRAGAAGDDAQPEFEAPDGPGSW